MINSGYAEHLMNEQKNIIFCSHGSTVPIKFLHNNLTDIFESCMRHDHIYLFHFLTTIILRDFLMPEIEHAFKVNWATIIEQAFRHSSINTVKRPFQVVEKLPSIIKAQLFQELLCNHIFNIIAARGCFEIFAYAFCKLRPTTLNLKGVLLYCLHNTEHLSGLELEARSDILKTIIELHPTLVKTKVNEWGYPLHVPGIHLSLLQILIIAGADVYARDHKGFTVAHCVANTYTGEKFHCFCEMMITMGYKEILAMKNRESNTPLDIALGHIEVQGRTIGFLQSEAAIDFSDTSYRRLFTTAICGGQNYEVFDQLQLSGVNIIFKSHWCPYINLHFAARYGNIKAINYMLIQGFNINSRDINHQTPLHWAFSKLNRNIDNTVYFLLKRNADIHAVDLRGWTALDYALNGEDGVTVKKRTIALMIKKINTIPYKLTKTTSLRLIWTLICERASKTLAVRTKHSRSQRRRCIRKLQKQRRGSLYVVIFFIYLFIYFSRYLSLPSYFVSFPLHQQN